MGTRTLKVRVHLENVAFEKDRTYIANPPEKEGFCYGCCFFSIRGCARTGGECLAAMRYDGKHKIFKRLN